MTQIATITSKKQLTIPAALFEKAGLEIGQKVIVSEEDGRLILTPTQKLVEELAGSVSIPGNLKGQDVDKIIEEAKKSYFQDKYQNK